MTEVLVRSASLGVVGESAVRPDGEPKVKGTFAYSSDLWREGAIWGATLRSPHPHAEILAVDSSAAMSIPGVHCVLTHEDVPGRKHYGMRIADQPVLAIDRVRYQGEPVAVVAAEHPELARRALEQVAVSYRVLEPLTDPLKALDDTSIRVHDAGNVVRHVRIRHGDAGRAFADADVVVSGDYDVGTQDQAFLGPESGLAVPRQDGGIDLFVASQHIHEDREQIAASLGLPAERVRVALAGVGGAFGGREDLSMHIHACLLALRTGRAVRMSYGREESFFGHVHRHPARIRVEHAATRTGRILGVRVRIILDGGAYASTSQVVIANASYFAAGAYDVPNVQIDGYAVYTHTPPNGAMRGFGVVQSCYAVESNVDQLARRLDLDPVQLRIDNALRPGSILPTGQAVDGPVPAAALLERLRGRPLPPSAPLWDEHALDRPGAAGNVTRGEGVRRGVGYALAMKAIGFSGGVDDTSTARVVLSVGDGEPAAEVYSAAAECGQGISTVLVQITRTELGIERVRLAEPDTTMADAGSSSASRQTWMAGGAVQGACVRVRTELFRRVRALAVRDLKLFEIRDGWIEDATTGDRLVAVTELLEHGPIDASFEYHHRQTQPIDPKTGQGDAHVAFAFAAHRAVVDVDMDLGLTRVVEVATAQDVGRAINPVAVEGQIEGGTAQGLGLALMEELQIRGGVIRNASFTDYLIPTFLDMPPVHIDLLELPHPDSPYGLTGVGELPSLSSTPAVANAVRSATGLELTRVPIAPDDIALCRPSQNLAAPMDHERSVATPGQPGRRWPTPVSRLNAQGAHT